MISNFNYKEQNPFLSNSDIRNIGEYSFLYPTLRQGLYQFFKDKKIKKILLPDFLPEGIYDPFKKLNCKIEFYEIDENTNIKKDNFLKAIEEFKPEVLVYIHHFGLYNKSNIDFIIDICKTKNILLVEDFAHTIFSESTLSMGDISTFSFTKMIGVSQGSLLWVNNKNMFFNSTYSKESIQSKKLKSKIDFHYKLLNIFSRVNNIFYFKSILFKLLKFKINYYNYLMANYTELTEKTSSESITVLNSVDFDAVSKRRKEIALKYVEGLDQKFMMKIPLEYFTKQALFAFPILVNKRNNLLQILSQNQIQALVLDNKWWFNTNEHSVLYKKHILLPINHYLTDDEIDKVIMCVNNFKNND